MKRSSGGGPSQARRAPSESIATVDKQLLWDDLQKRAATNAVFAPSDVAQQIGAGEAAVSKALLNLAYERMIERVDMNHYRAERLKDVRRSDFDRQITTKVDPKRITDFLEIERLKKNNDEMRRRLLDAVAERDRYLAILRERGIDPGPAPQPKPNQAVLVPSASPAEAAPAEAAEPSGGPVSGEPTTGSQN